MFPDTIKLTIAIVLILLVAIGKVFFFSEWLGNHPNIKKITESRATYIVLLVVAIVLLAGVFQDINAVREALNALPPTPKAPPAPVIVLKAEPPLAPINPPAERRCWIRNYAVPAVAINPPWGMATVLCNTTIKPPYSVELDYGEKVTAGPFTFPIGSEFTKSFESNQGTKVIGMFELHTIIPNEPFSIMAQGSGDKFPTVKTAVVRARGLAIEFRPEISN